jgi:hypothetical protein
LFLIDVFHCGRRLLDVVVGALGQVTKGRQKKLELVFQQIPQRVRADLQGSRVLVAHGIVRPVGLRHDAEKAQSLRGTQLAERDLAERRGVARERQRTASEKVQRPDRLVLAHQLLDGLQGDG